MARTKLPPLEGMLDVVTRWLARTSPDAPELAALERHDYTILKLDGVPLDESVKRHYLAWSFVELLDRSGVPVPTATVDLMLAGVSDEDAPRVLLDEHRVVFAAPLGVYYQLPYRAPKKSLEHATTLGLIAAAPVTPSRGDAGLLVGLGDVRSVLVDRASRSPDGWDPEKLTFKDAYSRGLLIEYTDSVSPPEQLRQQLLALDPRTSDVWRLLTAKALETEREDFYKPVTLYPDELAHALGFKPHPNGHVRPKDLVRCTEALMHLERMWLYVSKDGQQHLTYGETRQARGKRVVAVMEKGEDRIAEGQAIPSYWRVALGEWAQVFTREFAPIFRSLVELPANVAANVYAKQLGTELAYLYRESAGEGAERRLSMGELLGRAGLLREAAAWRKRRRVTEFVARVEETLDALREHGVHAGWSYDAASEVELRAAGGKRTYFDTFLASVVVVVVPENVLASFRSLASSAGSRWNGERESS
ncbi:hypothetical protein [Deinococcus pimensis]|uniref:hypothetical protein n=1 Tax=Deinococcus pimensis TaxID=309888 RepID=UPI000480EB9D|nr:hypothetical protein [Deinococcus pimensis]